MRGWAPIYEPLAAAFPRVWRAAMIDNLTILFSTLMVLFVAFRSIKLDRVLPWFPRPSLEPAPQPVAPPEEEIASKGRAARGTRNMRTSRWSR